MYKIHSPLGCGASILVYRCPTVFESINNERGWFYMLSNTVLEMTDEEVLAKELEKK